jgi:hypothetical protein
MKQEQDDKQVSQSIANANIGRSAVDKSIKLITALLNGKELEKHHAEYESPWYDNQVSGLRCYFSEYNGGEMFFEIWGWGSAFGKPEDRVIDVMRNPEKWDVRNY